MSTTVYFNRVGIYTPTALLLCVVNLLGSLWTNNTVLLVPAILALFLSDYVFSLFKFFYVRWFNKLICKGIFDRQLGYFTILIGTQKAFINYSRDNSLVGGDVLFKAALLDNDIVVAISSNESNYNKIIHYIAMHNNDRLYQLGCVRSDGSFEAKKPPEKNEHELLLKEQYDD